MRFEIGLLITAVTGKLGCPMSAWESFHTAGRNYEREEGLVQDKREDFHLCSCP